MSRGKPVFTTVRFLRYWVLRGVDRRFHEGETAQLIDWLADKLVGEGVAERVK